ncbi:MAG: hypothetical protein ABL871_16015 [Terricaulis sp.]
MRQVILALATLFLSTGTAAAQHYQLTDLTGAFTAAYDRTEGMPLSVRIKAFKTDVADQFPEFYGRQRYPGLSQADYDARIGRVIEGFAANREGYSSKAAQFAALLAPAYASFVQEFPDMGEAGQIYLLHSLGEMDGGTRNFTGEPVLIFGADVMGRAHPYADEEPFFHHELFHVYHVRTFGGCPQVWCSLWVEGLAVYVAQSLNTDATPEQLLLTVPEDIPGPVDANLREAVCTVRDRLDSTASNDTNALFSFQRMNERLPPRFGYYIGYLVARDAGRHHTIQELAHMDQATARPIIEASLARLARCT